MRRTLGTIAALAGWLCIPLSAVSAVVTSRMGGLSPESNGLTPDSVYGIPADLVLWVVVGAALLAAIPVVLTTLTESSWLPLFGVAAVLTLAGVALLPDELGRAYSLAMLPGAVLFGLAGWLIGSAQPAPKAAATNEKVLAVGPPVLAAPVLAAPFSPAVAPVAPEAALAAPEATQVGPEAAAPVAPEAAPVAPEAAPVAPEAAVPAAAMPIPPEADAAGIECAWCSTRNPSGAAQCSSCGAPLDERTFPADEPIPGVTAVAPEYRAYQAKAAKKKKRPSILSAILDNPQQRLVADDLPSQPGALTPPSKEVREQMDRIAFEIASGVAAADPGWTPSPPGGESSEHLEADPATELPMGPSNQDDQPAAGD